MDMPTDTREMLTSSTEAVINRHYTTAFLTENRAKPEIWDQLVDLGLVAAEISEDQGGLGLDLSDIAPSIEMMGRKLAITDYVSNSVIAAWIIANCDTMRDHIPSILDGEMRPVLAHYEAALRGSLDGMETRTKARGDKWHINGMKSIVVGGHQATHFIVPVRMESDDIGLFLVSAKASGVIVDNLKLYDGSEGAMLVLDNVIVTKSDLIAFGDDARDTVETALDRGRIALCYELLGLMTALQELTLDYVKQRNQFGQAIGNFQTMQHRMADMFMQVEISRSAALLALNAIGSHGDQKTRQRDISAAMVSIIRSARMVSQNAIQAHGGIALTREYIGGHYAKRMTLLSRWLGTDEDHMIRYLSLN